MKTRFIGGRAPEKHRLKGDSSTPKKASFLPSKIILQNTCILIVEIMSETTSKMILRSVLSLTIITAVAASNNFNYNDGARNSPYHYSEIQSVDFDFVYDDAETGSSSTPNTNQPRHTSLDKEQAESRMQSPYDYSPNSYDISVSEFESDDFEDQAGSPSVIASSVIYDGECYVSSEAMMCNGGGGEIDSFTYNDLFEDYEEPSDDEDDDDDNDGHSSMLSTASLRRSKSMARRERTRCHASGTSTTSKSNDQNTYVNKVVRLNNVLQLQPCRRSETLAFVRQSVFAVSI